MNHRWVMHAICVLWLLILTLNMYFPIIIAQCRRTTYTAYDNDFPNNSPDHKFTPHPSNVIRTRRIKHIIYTQKNRLDVNVWCGKCGSHVILIRAFNYLYIISYFWVYFLMSRCSLGWITKKQVSLWSCFYRWNMFYVQM